MNGLEIIEYISKDIVLLSRFGGLFAIDQLTFNLPNRIILYICNTDIAKKRGKHWIVIFTDPNSNRVEYFDSLGKYPPISFVKFMAQNGKVIIFNKRRVQSRSSKACGYFCLYFAFLKSRNIQYETIVNNFSNSYELNEKHVTKFIKQTLM